MNDNVILRALGIAAIAAFGVGLVGCGGEEPPVDPGDDPPVFPGGPGHEPVALPDYPAGPYGIGKGSVIANYQFVGYANSVAYNQTMQAIQLADFYNPHGRDPNYVPESPEKDDRLHGPGSQYGEGTAKPTVLLIDVASVWCGPCNLEAKTELPPRYAKYAPCGGQFLLQLADGPTVGEPATPTHLTNWTKKYQENFPAAIDPSYKLGSLFQSDAFPANMIIDTVTMTIVEVVAGVPSETFWAKYENLLADPSCPGQ
jgi:hypothetical protein